MRFRTAFNYICVLPCSLVVTYWERADVLGLLCVVFSCVLSLSHTSELRVRLVPLNMFKPTSIFTDRSKAVLLLCILFVICVLFLSL